MYRKIGGIIIYRRREYRCCSARVRSTWRAHSTWPLLFWRGRYYLSRALKLLPQMPINSEVDIILSSQLMNHGHADSPSTTSIRAHYLFGADGTNRCIIRNHSGGTVPLSNRYQMQTATDPFERQRRRRRLHTTIATSNGIVYSIWSKGWHDSTILILQ